MGIDISIWNKKRVAGEMEITKQKLSDNQTQLEIEKEKTERIVKAVEELGKMAGKIIDAIFGSGKK